MYAIDADTYSNEATYVLNDLCVYNDKLYKCIYSTIVNEDFNPSKWTEVDPESNGVLIDESDRIFNYNLNIPSLAIICRAISIASSLSIISCTSISEGLYISGTMASSIFLSPCM